MNNLIFKWVNIRHENIDISKWQRFQDDWELDFKTLEIFLICTWRYTKIIGNYVSNVNNFVSPHKKVYQDDLKLGLKYWRL